MASYIPITIYFNDKKYDEIVKIVPRDAFLHEFVISTQHLDSNNVVIQSSERVVQGQSMLFEYIDTLLRMASMQQDNLFENVQIDIPGYCAVLFTLKELRAVHQLVLDCVDSLVAQQDSWPVYAANVVTAEKQQQKKHHHNHNNHHKNCQHKHKTRTHLFFE